VYFAFNHIALNVNFSISLFFKLALFYTEYVDNP